MNDHLIAKELTYAEMFWVKGTQLTEFSYEISTLKVGKDLAANLKILKLKLFLDQHGLLTSQNLIILPGKQRHSRFLAEKEHMRLFHGGHTLMAASLAIRSTLREVA